MHTKSLKQQNCRGVHNFNNFAAKPGRNTLKKPLSLVTFVSVSLSVCLAAQHFCTEGINSTFSKLFGADAYAASALFCGIQQLACLAFGVFLYKVSLDGRYCEKYFCGMCILTWFILQMSVFGGVAAVFCLPWAVMFFMFYAVVFCAGKSDMVAALPHGVLTALTSVIAFVFW